MTLQWIGHSCFLMTSDSGLRVITDPYDPKTGYNPPAVSADIVTNSHKHADHSHNQAISGNFALIDTPGEHLPQGIRIIGHPCFHDKSEGAERGPNIFFVYELDGLRLGHAGDLGHLLTPEDAEKIGALDVLMIPVGGFYTINRHEATQLADLLRPKILIPMHFKTARCQFPIEDVEGFLLLQHGRRVIRQQSSELKLEQRSLPQDPEVHLLQYLR